MKILISYRVVFVIIFYFYKKSEDMKYCCLCNEELQELEKEFVNFLAVNQVIVDDWEKIKGEDNDKVDCLIEIFSDMVFDKVLEDVEYFEYKILYDLKVFCFGEEQVEMNGLKIEGEFFVDFI